MSIGQKQSFTLRQSALDGVEAFLSVARYLGAAIQGLGLAQVPGPLPKAPVADGRLQTLLAPFAITTPGVFLYYPD